MKNQAANSTGIISHVFRFFYSLFGALVFLDVHEYGIN
jgi:hypothetical protein